jgi:hypothetical protein
MCLAEQPSAGRKQDFKRLLYILKKKKVYTILDVVYIDWEPVESFKYILDIGEHIRFSYTQQSRPGKSIWIGMPNKSWKGD